VKPWVLWIAVPVFLATEPAGAEIFKCKAKNGADLYQNFPCEIDSLGLPSPNANPGAVRQPSSEPAATNARAAVGQAAAAALVKVGIASEPRRGMTPEEVRAIWGEPEQVIQDEPPSGRVEIWEYAHGRSVRFNNKERVLSVLR
jgi:hypothetical protein